MQFIARKQQANMLFYVSILSSLNVKLEFLTSWVKLTQLLLESRWVELKICSTWLELSWKCEQLDSRLIQVQNVNLKLNLMISLIENLNNLHIIFIVLMRTKQSYHEIISQKQRLSMLLKKYHEKIIRKHREWIRDVETSFQNTFWHFEKDEKNFLYCMIYLKSESKKLWFNHEETMFAAQQTWFNFIDFFLNLIENSMNWSINVTQQYVNALQRLNQMIWIFAVYLSILKHQLSLYSDEHKWTHLFIKLRSELHVIITNVQSISIPWNALIDLITWLKINLRKEHVLLLKQLWDENLHDQDKVNKKTYSKRKKFHWLTRLDSLSKTSSHALSHYSKNLFNITCYICNWKSHYFTDYKDEKVKNKLKEFDVNWFDLIWFEFIHSCDIDLSSTHERNYVMCIKWTKLFEKENRSSTTQWLHVVETINLTLCYQ